MHIHANNNLLLASIGTGREELSEFQTKRAAEVRRRLSAATQTRRDKEEMRDLASYIEHRAYESEAQSGEDDCFGHLFSTNV